MTFTRTGAKVNALEGGGNTALYWAAFYDRREIIELLLADRADVNKKQAQGETTLHVALRFRHDQAAEPLRKADARE